MTDDLNLLDGVVDLSWINDIEIDLSSIKLSEEEIDWNVFNEPIQFDTDWLKGEEIDLDWLAKSREVDWGWLTNDSDIDLDELKKDCELDWDWIKDLKIPEIEIDVSDLWKSGNDSL